MTLLHLTTPAEWAAGRIDPAPGEDFVHLSRPEQVHVPASLFYAGRTDLVALAVDPAKLVDEVRVEGGFPHLYGSLPADAVFDVLPFTHDVVFAPIHASEAPASDLLEAMVAEIEPMYGRVDGADRPAAAPDDLWRPGGTYLVGFVEGEPVAGGGVKDLGGGFAEIKRMYVAPSARGRGLARRLLTELEGAAARLGHTTVRLDTGPFQTTAKALYRSAGYVEIDDYNGNPDADFWAEKRLT
jgi:uncharacterized protein (DUF952 family)/ribosomal protein S18 acetylase RimI-like enzyme